MTGLLIGGLLDRSYESLKNRHWRDAFFAGVFGAVSVVSLGWYMIANPTGADPVILAGQARSAMLSELRKHHDMRDATIEKSPLFRNSDSEYKGVFVVVNGAQRQRFMVIVTLTEHAIRVTWNPIHD